MRPANESPPEPLDVAGLSWDRLAEPQADEYDTQVTRAFALRRGYQRAAPGRDPTRASH